MWQAWSVTYVIGKRSYGKETMAPTALTLTMVGAAHIVGVGLALMRVPAWRLTAQRHWPINTLVATAAATLSWIAGEALSKAKLPCSVQPRVPWRVWWLSPRLWLCRPHGRADQRVCLGLVCLWGSMASNDCWALTIPAGRVWYCTAWAASWVPCSLAYLPSPTLGGTGIFGLRDQQSQR